MSLLSEIDTVGRREATNSRYNETLQNHLRAPTRTLRNPRFFSKSNLRSASVCPCVFARGEGARPLGRRGARVAGANRCSSRSFPGGPCSFSSSHNGGLKLQLVVSFVGSSLLECCKSSFFHCALRRPSWLPAGQSPCPSFPSLSARGWVVTPPLGPAGPGRLAPHLPDSSAWFSHQSHYSEPLSKQTPGMGPN